MTHVQPISLCAKMYSQIGRKASGGRQKECVGPAGGDANGYSKSVVGSDAVDAVTK